MSIKYFFNPDRHADLEHRWIAVFDGHWLYINKTSDRYSPVNIMWRTFLDFDCINKPNELVPLKTRRLASQRTGAWQINRRRGVALHGNR